MPGWSRCPRSHAAPPETTHAWRRCCTTATGCCCRRMNARDAMAAFEAAEAEALAVVDGPARRVLGLLTEAHLLRRYGEEVEKRRREESGIVWSGTG